MSHVVNDSLAASLLHQVHAVEEGVEGGSRQRRYLRMAHTWHPKSKTISREILLLALLNSLPLALPPLVPCVRRQEKGANRRKRPPPGSVWRVRVDEPTAQAKPKDEADSSHDAFHASPAPGGVGRIVAPPIRIDTRLFEQKIVCAPLYT